LRLFCMTSFISRSGSRGDRLELVDQDVEEMDIFSV